MNIKKYLHLNSEKLSELENRYNYIANEFEVGDTTLSNNRSCLKETLKIAKLRRQNRFKRISVSEKRLALKRRAAVNSLKNKQA